MIFSLLINARLIAKSNNWRDLWFYEWSLLLLRSK
ncbi:hypothetical protein ACVMB3_007090 [Sinorhizobium meliloti]